MKLNPKTIAIASVALILPCGARAERVGDAGLANQPIPFTRAQLDKALDQGVNLEKLDVRPGVRVVPLDESWASDLQIRATRKQVAEQEERGFYTAPSGETKRVRRPAPAVGAASGLSRLDQPFRTIEEVQQHLAVKPATLGASGLTAAMVQEVRIAGGLVGGKWTGVARTFDVPGLGAVVLNETDHVAGNESVSLVKEWLNADVNGHPATAKTAHDDEGGVTVIVGWIDDRKIYSLTLDPITPELTEQNQSRLLEIARGLSES